MIKVALIALGCEKNVINSEQMLYLLDRAGFQTVGDPAGADVTVINTCGFIEDARQEALEQIKEVSLTPSKIILAGCMANRHKQLPVHGLPEVAGYVGTGRFDDIAAAVRAVMDGQTPVFFGNMDAPVSETPRIHTGPTHTAYLKIADGCDNRCAYCIIPALRGPYRSRARRAVFDEARTLCEQGVRELILVAQDVTRYGMDYSETPELPALLRELAEIPELRRLRLHYLYPELITDELIDTIASQQKIVKYLDIPIQHASDRILKAMNRRYTRPDLERLILKLREQIPGVVLRTSLIAGFPGEEQEDFNELAAFLQWAQIPRAGIFTYSREDGTPAAGFPGQVPEKTKRRRRRELERLQSRIIDDFNKQREGTTVDVLCEGYDRYAGVYFGRSEAESPDVDGKVFFTSKSSVETGSFVPVLLTGAVSGDGYGEA